MAYVLGFIFADGSIFKNPRGSHYLDLTSTDLELIGKLKRLLGAEHKIGVYNSKNKKWKRRYKLQIGSRDLFSDLNKYGVVPRKSLIMSFPNIPRKYLSHFVRGYFDGDGSVNFGKYWRKARSNWTWQFSSSFISGSEKFLKTLCKILNQYNMRGAIQRKNRGYELVFSRLSSLALFKLMYHNVSTKMFLERKHNIFLKALEKLNMRA